MKCTGCGSSKTVGYLELQSGDYMVCRKCKDEFARTNELPVKNLVGEISKMLDKCQKVKNGNKANP